MTVTTTADKTNDQQPMKNIKCAICQDDRYFASRNQLFDHLQSEHGYARHKIDNVQSAMDRTAASLAARSALFNPNHDAYYRLQCQAGVMPIPEWEQALASFCKPLPVAFRISSPPICSPSEVPSARQEYWKWLDQITKQSEIMDSSPHVPNCRVARRPPREWPPVLNQAWSDAQEVGIANRQELCSMVPPLFLLSNYWEQQQNKPRNQNGVTILDLCAAPGSKTLQLLDLLAESGNHDKNDGASSSPFQGLLVANDANRSRLLTVARRARLVGATSSMTKASLVLNSSDGRYFPALRKWAGYKFKFDYVLADVPCSGDGTLRKQSSKEWSRWNVKQHMTLHKLQLRLLVRSLHLVKKGGRVVYSTCSLDPMENEAVVASAIMQLGGPTVYRIVSPPKYLHLQTTTADATANEPFRYTPGASSWIVPHPKFDANSTLEVFETFEQVPDKLRRKDILPTMFPPDDNEPLLKDMLKNCCRILPHHLDSGGFFCAIIERVPPQYFAICSPTQRGMAVEGSSGSVHHGRIYQLRDEEEEKSKETPQRQIRTMLKVEKEHLNKDPSNAVEQWEFVFEGLPTLETAQDWLRQHSAFVIGRSETVSEFPNNGLAATPASPSKQWYDNTSTKESKPTSTPIYAPLVKPPHPDLIAEFVDFFGLFTTPTAAAAAGFDCFPVENMIVVGGGDEATNIKTNRMGLQSLLDDSSVSNEEAPAASPSRKTKYLQLTLVSKEIRTLFTGGAKFHPMEQGLALCRVPVCHVPKEALSNPSSRAEQSGRYGLMDEAAEVIGRCATKRVLKLSFDEGIHFLETGHFEEASRLWAEHSVPPPGGVIVLCPTSPPTGSQSSTSSFIFLSAVLRQDYSMQLLTERRAANAWLRWFQNVCNPL